MRRIVFLSILIIILTTCCTHRRSQYDVVLAEIDSLTEVNADSARAQLAALGKHIEGVDEETRAYYQLLRVKADDKAFIKPTSDSLISTVARYFESHPKSGHLPEAYYYVGRTNSELQNGEKALIYYQKALLEDSLHVTTRLKSRIYAQMGYIYLRNGLLEDAISMQQLAYFYCQQIGDTLGMRYSQEDIQTIQTMSQNLHISEYSQKEMMAKVQRLNTQVKNQMLHNENTKLQTENEHNKILVWNIAGAAVVVVALVILLAYRVWKQKRDANTASHPTPTHRKFYDKDISELLTTHIHNNKVLKDADWNKIEERLLAAFPSFKERLFSLYQLSETEYHICMLIKLEVTPSNMAKLMATGNSTISQSRLRMQQKVFNGQGTAKDWDKYVLSL